MIVLIVSRGNRKASTESMNKEPEIMYLIPSMSDNEIRLGMKSSGDSV